VEENGAGSFYHWGKDRGSECTLEGGEAESIATLRGSFRYFVYVISRRQEKRGRVTFALDGYREKKKGGIKARTANIGEATTVTVQAREEVTRRKGSRRARRNSAEEGLWEPSQRKDELINCAAGVKERGSYVQKYVVLSESKKRTPKGDLFGAGRVSTIGGGGLGSLIVWKPFFLDMVREEREGFPLQRCMSASGDVQDGEENFEENALVAGGGTQKGIEEGRLFPLGAED